MQKENEKEMRKMRKIVKTSLLLMAILTVVYACVVVYAYANANSSNANSSNGLTDHPYGWTHRYVAYGAFEYESETPPTEWYTPEQLGIVEILDYEENCTWFQVVVDREKEPFPLLELQEEELPIFKYKDKFYRISHLWVTPGLSESAKGHLIGGGVLVGAGWVFAGVLFLKGRKKE